MAGTPHLASTKPMDFHDRLKRAITRGRGLAEKRAASHRERQLSESELRALHTEWQLQLSEQIEKCLRSVADQFPGYRFQTIVDERGWGASVHRDDFSARRGKSANLYSRLELVIRKFAPHHVLELAGKATLRNRELFNRNYYERLDEADVDSFGEMIDLWTLEFAEQYARTTG